MRLVQPICSPLPLNLARTVVSSPHWSGEGNPGGGGKCRAKTANIFPTKPWGVQLASAIRPPGLVTRHNSLTTRSGRGVNMTPYMLTTTSKLASGYGMASASPSVYSILSDSCSARSRACITRLEAISRPNVEQPRRDHSQVPGATGGIENLLPGSQFNLSHELFGSRHDEFGHFPKITALPGGFLARFDGLDVNNRL